jgi:hypothetical protein
VIALIDRDAPIEACPREVSEAFEVPLTGLLDPARHIVQPRNFSGVDYDMFAVPLDDTMGRYRNIWGLTAGILRTLCEAYDAA